MKSQILMDEYILLGDTTKFVIFTFLIFFCVLLIAFNQFVYLLILLW